jgi:hypothetical protein
LSNAVAERFQLGAKLEEGVQGRKAGRDQLIAAAASAPRVPFGREQRGEKYLLK